MNRTISAGSASAKHTSAQARMPSGIRVPQAPTTLIPPNEKSRRVSLTGISTDAPGWGEGTQNYPHAANLFPMPSGSICSPVPALKSLNLSQAILDGLVVVGGLLALVIVFGSIPLAVGMMIFGVL